jgi:hypothetical protein
MIKCYGPFGTSILTVALDPIAGSRLVVNAAVQVLPVLASSTATTMAEALTTATALLAPSATLLIWILVVSIPILAKFVFP